MPIRYFRDIWSEMSATGRRTFPWDLVRSAMDGSVETMFRTFAMVIAIHYFQCSVIEKSVIASGLAVGLFLSPVYSSLSGLWLHRRTIQTFAPYLGIIVGALVAAFAPNGLWFALGILLASACHSVRFPSLIALYRENYKGVVRGQVLGLTVTLLTICGLLVTYGGGIWLDKDITSFRVFFVFFAIAAMIGGSSILKIPSGIVPVQRPDPPSTYIRVLKNHPMFAYVLASWFIFGFANLAMMPQQFELLSQEQYGFSLSPGTIALLIGLVPEITRLLFLQIWARIFDRFNIITIRIVINSVWLAYMILFFQTSSVWVIGLALCCRGVGFAGGSITWNLWVTKFADPEDTARYMSIHTFLTGVRGLIGPYVGYMLISAYSIRFVGWIAVAFILLATLMLIPLRRQSTVKRSHE
ncbi:MAG: MFS transporter [bacterium]